MLGIIHLPYGYPPCFKTPTQNQFCFIHFPANLMANLQLGVLGPLSKILAANLKWSNEIGVILEKSGEKTVHSFA